MSDKYNVDWILGDAAELDTDEYGGMSAAEEELSREVANDSYKYKDMMWPPDHARIPKSISSSRPFSFGAKPSPYTPEAFRESTPGWRRGHWDPAAIYSLAGEAPNESPKYKAQNPADTDLLSKCSTLMGSLKLKTGLPDEATSTEVTDALETEYELNKTVKQIFDLGGGDLNILSKHARAVIMSDGNKIVLSLQDLKLNSEFLRPVVDLLMSTDSQAMHTIHDTMARDFGKVDYDKNDDTEAMLKKAGRRMKFWKEDVFNEARYEGFDKGSKFVSDGAWPKKTVFIYVK